MIFLALILLLYVQSELPIKVVIGSWLIYSIYWGKTQKVVRLHSTCINVCVNYSVKRLALSNLHRNHG